MHQSECLCVWKRSDTSSVNYHRAKHYCGGPSNSVLSIVLLVEAILFGLFTLCMMADQSEAISSNQTQIDRLKNEKHDIQVSAVNLRSDFL